MRVRFPGMSKSEAEVLEGFGYYSQSGGGNRKKSWHNVTVLVGLVLLWYCGAVVTITTTKVIMNATKLPFLLCTVQFIFASVLARLYIRNIQGGNLASDTSSINPLLFQISVSYTFGFILTNTAFSIGIYPSIFFRSFKDYYVLLPFECSECCVCGDRESQ